MPFVNPFSRNSPDERKYRATGSHRVMHFVPEYVFEAVEALHTRYASHCEGTDRTYVPVLVAEVEVLDVAEYPDPLTIPDRSTSRIPIRVLRLVE